jgi:tetratricopeptide (TPR) repeat protein
MINLSTTTFAQLSDYQKFASYPYLEKAYRLQTEKRFSDAIEELKSAIATAPEHQPYKILMFELLIANKQTDEALDLYSTLTNEAKGSLLSSLIEIQIESDNLQLTNELKQLIEETPSEQRQELYKAVAGRLVAKGQENLTHEWLSQVKNLSPELLEMQMRLSDKLGKFADVEKYYLAIPEKGRTADAQRNYAFSLLRQNKTEKALLFANLNPKSQLSFDIYYQYLQESIAQDDAIASATAFDWIEQHHQLTPKLFEQRFEQAIKMKDRNVAFAMMPQLNFGCQKRIEVALSFDWQSKAQQELISCQNTMQKAVWLTYADTLLSIEQLKKLIANNAKHSTSISKLLINRYIAQQQYQHAIDEIKRAKLTSSFIETLALSHEKLGQLELATAQFVTLYHSTNSDRYLDKSTFLLVEQDKNLEALTLLEKRLIAAPTNMPKQLIERTLQIYQQQPNKLNSAAINSLVKVTAAQDRTAEVLRLVGHCDEAVSLLNKNNSKTALSWTTRALCVAETEPRLALKYWQQAYEQSQDQDTLRALAYAQGNAGNSVIALKTLNQLGEKDWTKADYLYAAQLYYQQKNYQKAESYWLLAKNTTGPWLDFGVELSIQQGKFVQAQSLSTQLLESNADFTAQQWARQAQIYQQTDQSDKAIRAWQVATEVEPESVPYKLSRAYSLIESQPQKAYQMLQELSENAAHLDSSIWEQLGYLATENSQQDVAVGYVKKSIETEDQSNIPRGQQLTWDLHQFYRDLSQNWHFTSSFSQGTGAILGEVFFENNENGMLSPPTNNITARAEYFFNTTNKSWSAYAQLSGNGTDDKPLSDWSKELGISYRILDQYNVKASIGAQRFFSGDWEAVARLNGDLFNQGKWRQGWRYAESWWQRQFYFDLLFLPESEQLLGLVRFDMGYVEPLDTSSKQTVMYYGLAQYDMRKLQFDNNGNQSTYTQSSLGLGVKWSLFATPEIVYDRVHTYSLALEWRLTVSGDLTNDDSSVFLIGTYQY